MTSNVAAYTWKNMPFWTVIFLAGRMAIPTELYEAASVDGATGLRRFRHVTFPLLANLYLVSTLLSTIWSLGEFNAVYFVTGGGPAMSTEVLATLGIRHAFVMGEPRMGVATVMSALPVLIPIVIILMHKLRKTEVQL
jgi:multiple sugar transport system permease protein